MFQIRGLGAIPLSQYGVTKGPVLVAPSTFDVSPMQPATMYPTAPMTPVGGGGAPPYQPLSQLVPGTMYEMPAPTVPPTMPPPLPAPPVVSPPIPVAPVATNPANPDMPAPGGTQVSVAQPWNQSWYRFGMSPKLWLGVGLGLLALVGGAVAVHHAHH